MTKVFDHFELTSADDLKCLLGGVKVVLVCGSRSRASKIVKRVQELKLTGATTAVPIGSKEYFELTRVGKVAVCSHGMGLATIAICLDELTGMLHVAGCEVMNYIRIGSSGGIGVPGGALVVTTSCLSEDLTTNLNIISEGKDVALELGTPYELAEEIRVANEGKLPVTLGKTISGGTYYEGQARLDGSIAEYTEADKFDYLKRAYSLGARNFEMEGTILANHCQKHPGIRCGMVCASYLDRLKGDQSPENATAEDFKEWQYNTMMVVMNWLDKYHREIPSQILKARTAAGMRKTPRKVVKTSVSTANGADQGEKLDSTDSKTVQVIKTQKMCDMSTKQCPSTFTPPKPSNAKGITKSQGFQPAKPSKQVNQHMRKHHNISQPRKITHSKLGSRS